MKTIRRFTGQLARHLEAVVAAGGMSGGALKINELKQAVIDGKAALTALLNAQAEAKTALAALLRAEVPTEAAAAKAHADAIVVARSAVPSDAKVKASREALQLVEEALHAEEQRIELEDAALAANPSGRIRVEKDLPAAQPWHTEADGPADQARHIGLGRWAMAVAQAITGRGIDPRLGSTSQARAAIQAAATGMNESSGELGGFALPVEYAPGIESLMFESGDILSRVDVRTIIGNAITYTVMNETSRVDGSRQGGVLGYWLDEAGLKLPSTAALARLEMKLRKVAAVMYATDELLEDAAALGQEIEKLMAEELTFQTENKIWRGLGGATPLGFTQAPCFVSVAKETGQAAATILAENLSKMWARLPARCQANAAWFCNVDVQPALDFLSIPAGTAALEPRFVNYNAQGILTIKGRPVIPVEYAETLGTLGDLVVADMSKYRLVRKANGIQQTSSIHVAFLTDQTAFRAVYRVDGQPVPRAAITPFKGTATLSPFVGLETRA